MPEIRWPLMDENISRQDLDTLIDFLRSGPRLTQAGEVRAFEAEWSDWIGCKESIFVNSGSSANLLTMHALRQMRGAGEVILPPLAWSSDVVSVLNAGLTPVFADISWKNLSLDPAAVERALTPRTRAVFLTHILGLNGLTPELLRFCEANDVLLVEDACESYGAVFQGRRVGSIGYAGNFSFYYGHHMSTVEGGMISSDDPEFCDTVRMLRSHGMARECRDPARKAALAERHPDLHPEFIFAYPGFNMRGTEMQAVLGRSQLKSLNERNSIRIRNNDLFLSRLDPEKYFVDFDYSGSVSYAFLLVLHPRRADLDAAREKVTAKLNEMGVEFRRGLSGGGNLLRQPFVREALGKPNLSAFPVVEFIHRNGFYLGNYPGLGVEAVEELCAALNSL